MWMHCTLLHVLGGAISCSLPSPIHPDHAGPVRCVCHGRWKVDGAEVKCLDEDSARSAGACPRAASLHHFHRGLCHTHSRCGILVLRLFAGNAAGKPVVHEPCFITESTFAPGKHTIEIEMGEPWQDHDNFIPLSHLITY